MKGITLDEAREAVDGQRIAVIAAIDYVAVGPAVRLMSRYASQIYSMESVTDRQAFQDFMHRVLHENPNLPALQLGPEAPSIH